MKKLLCILVCGIIAVGFLGATEVASAASVSSEDATVSVDNVVFEVEGLELTDPGMLGSAVGQGGPRRLVENSAGCARIVRDDYVSPREYKELKVRIEKQERGIREVASAGYDIICVAVGAVNPFVGAGMYTVGRVVSCGRNLRDR